MRQIVGPDAEIQMSTQRKLAYGPSVRVTALLIGNDSKSGGEASRVNRFNDLSSQSSLLIYENLTPVRRRAPILLPTG